MDKELSNELRTRMAAGDPAALSEATALLYRELRTAARSEMRTERKNHTLQPTSLVHEVLIRLRASSLKVETPAHFVNVAREVMRHVLKDHARARSAAKRSHTRVDAPLEAINVAAQPEPITPEWNKAIDRLEQNDPTHARVIQLRYRLGHTWDEIAERMGISVNQARYLETEAIRWLRKLTLRPRRA